jgi:hypothetical protein
MGFLPKPILHSASYFNIFFYRWFLYTYVTIDDTKLHCLLTVLYNATSNIQTSKNLSIFLNEHTSIKAIPNHHLDRVQI